MTLTGAPVGSVCCHPLRLLHTPPSIYEDEGASGAGWCWVRCSYSYGVYQPMLSFTDTYLLQMQTMTTMITLPTLPYLRTVTRIAAAAVRAFMVWR